MTEIFFAECDHRVTHVAMLIYQITEQISFFLQLANIHHPFDSDSCLCPHLNDLNGILVTRRHLRIAKLT